jgi:hypothetical protein
MNWSVSLRSWPGGVRQVCAARLGESSKMSVLCLNIVFKHPDTLMYLYIRLKCSLFPCPISLSLHVSPVYSHRPVQVYVAKIVLLHVQITLKKGKNIPVTGRGGPQGCETSRLPHFLGNRLTDVGKVVSLTRRPPFTPRKIHGINFC